MLGDNHNLAKIFNLESHLLRESIDKILYQIMGSYSPMRRAEQTEFTRQYMEDFLKERYKRHIAQIMAYYDRRVTEMLEDKGTIRWR